MPTEDQFTKCLAFVLLAEGGNDDDPQDPGGRTSRGILQSEYNTWCHANGVPQGDVWKATDEQIKAIYHANYWVPLQCDNHNWPLNAVLFDTGVNCGIGHAQKWLQLAWHLIPLDSTNKPADLASQVMKARDQYYNNLSTKLKARFLKGWLNRDHDLRVFAGLGVRA